MSIDWLDAPPTVGTGDLKHTYFKISMKAVRYHKAVYV